MDKAPAQQQTDIKRMESFFKEVYIKGDRHRKQVFRILEDMLDLFSHDGIDDDALHRKLQAKLPDIISAAAAADWAAMSSEERKGIEVLFIHTGDVTFTCKVCGKGIKVTQDRNTGRLIRSNLLRHWNIDHKAQMKVRG